MSSVGGVGISHYQAPYIASKHAVLSLTECLYQEIALTQAPIQVSAVLPGGVQSRIFLDAQSTAPAGDPRANRFFDRLQTCNDTIAIAPDVAAERILNSLPRGDFWVFTDDKLGRDAVERRGLYLMSCQPPPDPTEQFRDAWIEPDVAR